MVQQRTICGVFVVIPIHRSMRYRAKVRGSIRQHAVLRGSTRCYAVVRGSTQCYAMIRPTTPLYTVAPGSIRRSAVALGVRYSEGVRSSPR
eukprot:9644601-Alexandrium_andersonii.AAC.1